MDFPAQIKQQTCMDCLSGKSLGFEIRMAFQPIIHWPSRENHGYEALVRGPNGEGAGWVFERINESNKYYFDQACRVKAIETASKLGLDKMLSINFLPNAVYNPETCIRATIEAADMYGFDIHKIMFEVTEGEQIVDRAKLVRIFESYAKRGFITAIDDFGSGFADLSWLDALRPQVLKLDMTLIRDIDVDKEKQQAVDEILRICLELNTRVLAEGVESEAELNYLAGIGIEYFQGYYFAKPKLEYLTTYEELNFQAP
ncbi:EAL domain-containing protein [Shewanella sp. SP1S1-7]|uniref:EAL domain-containing protein n=1 Tax=Shewanella sp. SP1S1-7 TaxID=3063536 RepID=UPI002890E00A|nr:EAL domain-containing protein [Shewanella sp. SP1S1-7]MDT3335255.1 EAL domain-containing protein [Shewanella sp. SP1S1-7]